MHLVQKRQTAIHHTVLLVFLLSLLFSFFRGKWVNQASEVKMEKLVPRFEDFKPFRHHLYIISRLTVIKVKNMQMIYIPATERTSGVSYQLCKRQVKQCCSTLYPGKKYNYFPIKTYPLADNLSGHGYLEQPGSSMRGIMMLTKLCQSLLQLRLSFSKAYNFDIESCLVS